MPVLVDFICRARFPLDYDYPQMGSMPGKVAEEQLRTQIVELDHTSCLT